MSKRIAPLLFGLLLALAIAYTSTLPTEEKHALHTQGWLHPWLHLLGFALVATLLMKAARSSAVRIALFTCLLVFGWATEKGESHKDGWPIETKDVFTDAIGVMLGSFAGFLLQTPELSRVRETR